jgi:hypothetical protein
MRARRGQARQFFDTVVLPYEDDACLPWPFAVGTHGYGTLGKKTVPRLLCTITRGPAPRRAHSAHDCGFKLCVNKRHVWWKTPSENALDRHRHGTMNNKTKITKADAEDVRRAVANGSPYKPLQAKYGISAPTISRIVNG